MGKRADGHPDWIIGQSFRDFSRLFVPREGVCYSEGMIIISGPVSLTDLKAMAQGGFEKIIQVVQNLIST